MNITVRKPGRPDLYPYSIWTNGEVWAVRRGQVGGFNCEPHAFVSSLRSKARKLGKRVAVQVTGDTVTFHFYSDEPAASSP